MPNELNDERFAARTAQVFQPAVPLRVLGVWLDDAGRVATQEYPFLGVQVSCVERYVGSDRKGWVASPGDVRVENVVLFWERNGIAADQNGITRDIDFRAIQDSVALIVAPATLPSELWDDMIASHADILRTGQANEQRRKAEE